MRRLRAVLAEAYRGFGSHNIGQAAAALAYYGVLTLAPLLTVLIAVAGRIVGQERVTELVVEWLTRTVGADAAATVAGAAANYLFRSSGNTVVLAVSAVLTLFGAIGVFVQVTRTLRMIWDTPSKGGVKESLLLNLIGLAVLAALSIGTVALVSLLTIAAPLMGSTGSTLLPLFVSALAVGLLFMEAYRRLSGAHVRASQALWGAIPGGAGYALGSILLGLYIDESFAISAYGSAGSLLAVLIWLYYSATLFLVCAEIARAAGVVESPSGA